MSKVMEIHLPDEIAHYEGDLRFFVEGMVDKLNDNRDKGKWDDVDVGDAYSLMSKELEELNDALFENNTDDAFWESVDIANFAMIIGLVALKGTNNPFASRVKIGQPIKFLEWASTQSVDGCILWPFKSRTGAKLEYGSVSKGQSEFGRRAHRVLCGMAHGKPPTDKHEASHLCGNSLCVNPKHVIWETHNENQARKLEHGTRVTPVKLDWDKARELRKQRFMYKKSARELASIYGVSTTTIYKVLNDETYNEAKAPDNKGAQK